jgi:hypothetical protein
MGQPKCDCRHLGHCPFQAEPLRMTDLNGEPLFRALTEDEQLRARVMVEGQDLRDPEPGDFLGTDRQGNAAILAKAIDAERVVAYGTSKTGRRCKADSFMWRKTHPIPKFMWRKTHPIPKEASDEDA